ncbi:tRNA (adenosine(37)-N6)-threonylcarbamoyltransferase complex transferase subunit TsaD [bacterium]|nr:MAG: tRNA (adenosine(37)-N6)-threonylcarbamoyltransferase complex transferase subunit TsaD [bacterium]QQR62317.1 MAG: tRNA (adenosine(37)-N6)-threonylcarbamoyltransferase complex transferase subunit TsaD [bacterium]QQR63116.1 MAG: tRNA (adenosine(37)-N6)-threonylcarbamoyltransferase complex transferase subunit TsaD [bacterium]
MSRQNLVLGIETSCDETGMALYCPKEGLLTHTLFSQIDLHACYGGVIPELASRTQLEKIHLIFQEIFNHSSFSFQDVKTVAVTNRPGLPGSLLVGVSFAKAVAWAGQKKLIGINHLEGHIFSSFLEHNVPFPHLCLTASGGHTSLYLVEDFSVFSLICTTKDDAAGEAFDKIAKLMNLPYPGGPVIEKMGAEKDFYDFYAYPRCTAGALEFSFSGLKTAVLYHLVKLGAYDLKTKQFCQTEHDLKQQVASSLLVCIKDIFLEKIGLALAVHKHIKAVTFVGGCAANTYLKKTIEAFCINKGLQFFAPSPKFCTDNGAMIAFVGNYKVAKGQFDSFDLDITL